MLSVFVCFQLIIGPKGECPTMRGNSRIFLYSNWQKMSWRWRSRPSCCSQHIASWLQVELYVCLSLCVCMPCPCVHTGNCTIKWGWGHVTGNIEFFLWFFLWFFRCVLVLVCLHVYMHLSCRGWTVPAVSPVREDLAASHQTSQCCAGTQVQPQEETHSSTLPLPEKQTCRLLCPHSAGESQTLLLLFDYKG